MCGICGEVRFDGGPVRIEDVAAMRDRLIHRGPDSAGVHVAPDARAGLGFRRLRIIDLSPNANQPMPNEDGSVHLVFNGEIYNFAGLRDRLIAHGHQFRSRADSEVIIHLYEEQGPACIEELDGMFALAIWDQRRHTLLLARDRAGKKPLFYWHTGTRVLFASEVKAFFGHPDLQPEIDEGAIPSYFVHGYVPCPDTFYRGVKQVEPGSLITIDGAGRMERRTYWQLRYDEEPGEPIRRASRRDASKKVRELVTAAVERRLMSDVPLGAFLSGGIDSTIVVGVMSRLMNQPVKTFSIGFEGDPRYDETRYAQLAAKRFGTDHTEFRVSPASIDLTEKLIWHHDGPFGDSSAVPTYIVSELTRQHVTVVLTGDGGDELFAGYIRFYAAVLAERVPAFAGHAANTLAGMLGTPASARHPLARAQRFTRAMNLPLYERMTRWSSLFYEDVEALLHPDLRARLAPVDRLRYLAAERSRMESLSTLRKLLHANFKSYLLDDLLVKMDRCSMANSLEARAPFLDTALIEYVMRLPDEAKLRWGRTKVILREAFADLLPDEILNRGKMGFGIPFGSWFRRELRDYLNDLLLASDARYRTYLSAPFVHEVVRRHQAGEGDLGLQLWSLLCFELWLRLLPEWRRAGAVPASVLH